MIMKIFKFFVLIFVLIIIFGLCIPALESYFMKEIPYFESQGNCRVVNIDKTYKLKDAKIIFHKTKNGTTHVVAVDSDSIVHDLSKGGEDNNGISYEKYKKDKFKKHIYTAILENGSIVKSIISHNDMIVSYTYGYYVFISILVKN